MLHQSSTSVEILPVKNAASVVLNKLPAVTGAFWIMKIAATTLGETLGDYLSKGSEHGGIGRRADVSVTLTGSGSILEWFKYSAYGVVKRVPLADFNRDNFVDLFDDLDFDDCFTGVACPPSQSADLNFDGMIDMFDESEFDDAFADQVVLSRGELSQSGGRAATNRVGYAGYFFESATQQYIVRNREVDPLVGMWDERDPIGYSGGVNQYAYVNGSPLTGVDPMGLMRSSSCGGGGCAARSNSVSGSHASQAAWNLPSWWQWRYVFECVESQQMLRNIQAKCGGVVPIRMINCDSNGRPEEDQPGNPASADVCGYAEWPTVTPGPLGTQNCTPPRISLCRPSAACPNTCRTLIHELQHASDMCHIFSIQPNGTCFPPSDPNGGAWTPTCFDVVCLELRAYTRDRSCAGLVGRPYLNCLCDHACASASGSCLAPPGCWTTCISAIVDRTCSGVRGPRQPIMPFWRPLPMPRPFPFPHRTPGIQW